MKYFKGMGAYGPFFGMEQDNGIKWCWENGTYQIFPYPTLSMLNLEYINPIDFFRFMKEHCEIMIKELERSEDEK